VLVGARPRGDRVVIEVRDGGPGIPPARQLEIFGAFRQIEGATAGGLGLGLSIVDGLAGLLGHEVGLRSEPGRGSTFTLTARRGVAPRAAVVAAPAAGALAPLVERVLVVDDDPSVRDATASLLMGWGCEPREAADSGEVEAALADGWRPDFVLADFHLGDETGLELLEKLRVQLGEELRAAILTAETAPERLAPIREAGYALLRKPVRPAQLRALLSAER
jgi:CheY-like chemotaxis protein